MKQYPLNLTFKGDRTYIHGCSMVDESTRILNRAFQGEISMLEFMIHKMTNKNLFLKIYDLKSCTSPSKDDIAITRFVINGQPILGRICSTSGQPNKRSPYNEAEIVDLCEINFSERKILLLSDISTHSAIEILVAMNKSLHLQTLKKPESSSWVFCRWDSPKWPLPKNLNGVTISIKQALGSRLTKSEVCLNGAILGNIYFSAKATL